VDDRPASIFVDLGVATEAPLTELPVLGYVRIRVRRPREDGLSSQAEFEALTAVEHALETLQVDCAVAYVGRNTSDGHRDLYFYLRTAEAWEMRVAGIMKAFPDYQFESGTRADPKWTTYFRTLVSIVGPTEARPADGLAVDFVVEADRAQLNEIVQRVRDGRLRTNIGNIATLDDAVAAFNPTKRISGKTIIRFHP
jgi:NADPH:quinone reductase-like Zn-dependent oxidoreductase